MSKQEFLGNLRTARNLLVHQVETDNPHLNAADTERRLARAAIWLTPAAVRGFDVADFAELPQADRNELERNVLAFLQIAEQVPPTESASPEQFAEALRAFTSILRLTEPYLPTGDELRRLRDAMSEVHFPPMVYTWEAEFGRDSTGDPAVWIWFLVDDEAANDPTFTTTTNQLQREIHTTLQRAGVDRWPYVRFRTASERKELQAVSQ